MKSTAITKLIIADCGFNSKMKDVAGAKWYNPHNKLLQNVGKTYQFVSEKGHVMVADQLVGIEAHSGGWWWKG